MKKEIKILVGRKEEIEDLEYVYNSDSSEFVAMYGRRRIGKTYLIKTLFRDEICFELTGIKDASQAEQLEGFYEAIKKCSPEAAQNKKPRNWSKAFIQLQAYISSIKSKKKKVIFLDEVPWLASQKSNFLKALDHFWNSYASWEGNIMLIICGSAASWIITKVINDRGGLHNRVTKRIRLMPFTLAETKEFLHYRGVAYNNYQIMQLYMVTGGVPHYLREVQKTKSVAQNINDLCFKKDGLLKTEFDNLYSALFKNAELHIEVIRALAKKNKGLTRNDVIKYAKLQTGGTMSKVLNELIESGFVEIATPYKNRLKETVYRLTDSYSIFYLKYIEGINYRIRDVWLHISQSQGYKSWCGFSFENICLQHIDQIAKAMGISGIGYSASSFVNKGEDSGVQIDLIIDRNDNIINLCEMKFASKEYTITKDYDKELRNKVALFEQITNTNKGVVLTMITPYGLSQNAYAHSVPIQLKADILFER